LNVDHDQRTAWGGFHGDGSSKAGRGATQALIVIQDPEHCQWPG